MALAGAAFLLTHFVMSSTSMRPGLVGVLGENGFLGVYSLVAFATLGAMIWVYMSAPRIDYFWFPNPDLYWVPKVLVAIASVLLVGSFMVKNPTQVGLDGVLADESFEPQGMLRITRHPLQWAICLWAVSHLVANGDVVSVAFFATFAILSGFGTVLMDRKKAAKRGEHWQSYAAVTSNVPFLAILQGRNKLVVKEWVLPLVVGVVLYLAMYFGHEWLSGVPIA